jgi:hypothetical protein
MRFNSENHDYYITDKQLSFRTDFEIYLQHILDNPIFNKLKTDNIDLKELEIEINKFIQIHSLRCKKCKLKKNVCQTTQDLNLIYEVLI